jgi:hypothetical protein
MLDCWRNSFAVHGIPQNTSLVSQRPCQHQLHMNAFHFDQEWEMSRYVTFFLCFAQQNCASPQSSHGMLFCPISSFFLAAQALNGIFIIQRCPRTAVCNFQPQQPIAKAKIRQLTLFLCLFDHLHLVCTGKGLHRVHHLTECYYISK